MFARGNERRAIYRDDNDRASFLELLEDTAVRFGWSVLAYCLMTNHYHLVFRTSEANLAAGMHRLNALYAQRFNRRHGRVGHLFQGRYKARLVEDGEGLVGAIRYSVRNPVRARICAAPEHWRWSSQRAVLGLSPPGLVPTRDVLSLFHHERPQARHLYLEFTNSAEEQRSTHPLVDGGSDFTATALARIEPTAAYPKRMLRPTPPLLETMLGSNPTSEHLRAARSAGHTVTSIAAYLQLHKSTISRRLAAATSPAEEPASAQRRRPAATNET